MTNSIVTNTGHQKMAAALANNETINIEKMAVGTGTAIPAGGETELAAEVYRDLVVEQGLIAGSPNEAYFRMIIPENGEDETKNYGPWAAGEVGLFDDEGDLIVIARLDPPQPKYDPESGSPNSIHLTMRVVFTNIEAINITYKPDFNLPWATSAEAQDEALEHRIMDPKRVHEVMVQALSDYDEYLPRRLADVEKTYQVLFPKGAAGKVVGDDTGALEITFPAIPDDETPIYGVIEVQDFKTGPIEYGFVLKKKDNEGDQGGAPIIPDLTANNSAAPLVVSASGVYQTQEPYLACDRDNATFWENNGEEPSWLQVDHGAGNEIRVGSFSLLASHSSFHPSQFKLQGSDDAVAWTDLKSVTGASNSSSAVTYVVDDDSTAYRYHRLYITDAASNTFHYVHEFQLYTAASAPTPSAAGPWDTIEVSAVHGSPTQKLRLTKDGGDVYRLYIGEIDSDRRGCSFALKRIVTSSNHASWFEGWSLDCVEAFTGATVDEAESRNGVIDRKQAGQGSQLTANQSWLTLVTLLDLNVKNASEVGLTVSGSGTVTNGSINGEEAELRLERKLGDGAWSVVNDTAIELWISLSGQAAGNSVRFSFSKQVFDYGAQAGDYGNASYRLAGIANGDSSLTVEHAVLTAESLR